MKASETITHINNPEDIVYLKTKAFPVSMRLFKSSVGYRQLIDQCCALIREHALATYDDYKNPHGMSGANLGIPFNIIGIVKNRGEKSQRCEILINPKISDFVGQMYTMSNCGSIRLKKPIKISRFKEVKIKYYDEDGILRHHWFGRESGSATAQHEIDHNNGVLITDRI